MGLEFRLVSLHGDSVQLQCLRRWRSRLLHDWFSTNCNDNWEVVTAAVRQIQYSVETRRRGYLSACLPACLSACLSIYLSIYLSMIMIIDGSYMSAQICSEKEEEKKPTYKSIYLSVCLSASLPAFHSVCLCVDI